MVFINRIEELARISRDFRNAGLGVVYGRRRVGKSTLIKKWGEGQDFWYTQAIESSPPMQLQQLTKDLSGLLPEGLSPGSWPEFFSMLALVKQPHVLVIDEFPYLVKSDPALLSILQNYIDNLQSGSQKLFVLGSSQSTMHSSFMSSDSPLYERASVLFRLLPMSYLHFCQFMGFEPSKKESFLNFSMVGGVPKYWSFLTGSDPLVNAEQLFFEKSARLELEPDRLLKDEGVEGSAARYVLEAVGRGATRSGQIAARLSVGQNTISKPLRLLMDCSLLERLIPFGESTRNPKRTLYRISDPALSFWFHVYSPHRSRWHALSPERKLEIISTHAGSVLESQLRERFPGSSPYWEGGNIELDCVRFQGDSHVVVSEVKLGSLSQQTKISLLGELKRKVENSKLVSRFDKVDCEVLAFEDVIASLA